MTRRAGRGRPGRERLAGFAARVVAAGAATAAACQVGGRDDIWETGVAGREGAGEDPPVDRETLFDLASLTKPFVATLALAVERSGDLPLGLPLGEVWPSAALPMARLPLEALLRHRAGLAAWTPLYARCRTRAEARVLLLGGELLGARAGTYSDLGYILWGLAAEARLRAGLGELLRRHVLDPLGIADATPSPGDREGVAACFLDNRREVDLAAGQGIEVAVAGPPSRGRPQDGNARFLGGLAGHAGIFGSLDSLWRLTREWLRPQAVLDPQAVDAALGGGGAYALGWKRSRGGALGRAAFGHQGFTGGDLWWLPDDPEARILLLLAHRRHALRSFSPWRRRFRRLALEVGSHGP